MMCCNQDLVSVGMKTVERRRLMIELRGYSDSEVCVCACVCVYVFACLRMRVRARVSFVGLVCRYVEVVVVVVMVVGVDGPRALRVRLDPPYTLQLPPFLPPSHSFPPTTVNVSS
jgi:hypothetical protein